MARITNQWISFTVSQVSLPLTVLCKNPRKVFQSGWHTAVKRTSRNIIYDGQTGSTKKNSNPHHSFTLDYQPTKLTLMSLLACNSHHFFPEMRCLYWKSQHWWWWRLSGRRSGALKRQRLINNHVATPHTWNRRKVYYSHVRFLHESTFNTALCTTRVPSRWITRCCFSLAENYRNFLCSFNGLQWCYSISQYSINCLNCSSSSSNFLFLRSNTFLSISSFLYSASILESSPLKTSTCSSSKSVGPCFLSS